MNSTKNIACGLKIGAIMLVACLFFAIQPPSASAQAVSQITPEKVKKILRCPTADSKQFVDDAFLLAKQGKIPEKILLSAFNYAKERPENKRWFYFQQVLDQLCSQVNINLTRLRQNLR